MNYVSELIWTPVVIGVVAVLCVPTFALLGLAYVLVIAARGLVSLVGTSVAAPYLLARHLFPRWRNGTSVRALYLLARLLHRRALSLSAARQASARSSGATARQGAARLHPRLQGDEITVSSSVEPADGLETVLFAARRTKQALLETTSAGPARVRAMLAAATQPSGTLDAAKAPVR